MEFRSQKFRSSDKCQCIELSFTFRQSKVLSELLNS